MAEVFTKIFLVMTLCWVSLVSAESEESHGPSAALPEPENKVVTQGELKRLFEEAKKEAPTLNATEAALRKAAKAIDDRKQVTVIANEFPHAKELVEAFETFVEQHKGKVKADDIRTEIFEEDSEPAPKSAKPEEAQESARLREKLRELENEVLNKDRADRGRSGGAGSGGSGGDGDRGDSSGQNSTPFPSPNNASQNSNSGNSTDPFNQLMNKLGSSNQGLGNFSISPNSSKKEDEKKSDFSLGSSKSNAKDDFFSSENSAKKASPTLPKPLGNDLPELSTAKNSLPPQGEPLTLMDAASQPGISKNNNSGFNGSQGNGMNNSGMSNAVNNGMAGQSQLGSLGGNGDFPFNITGEPAPGESEGYEGPRFRTVPITMNGSSDGQSDGMGSVGSGAASSPDASKRLQANGIIPQNLYTLSAEEAALKNVPGVFRSLAAGFRTSRIQNLCKSADKQVIGVCSRLESQRRNQ